jgi:hypothetical protein
MNNKTGLVLKGILVVIIVIFVGLAINHLLEKNDTSIENTSFEESTQSSGLLPYHNDQYGFRFSYPAASRLVVNDTFYGETYAGGVLDVSVFRAQASDDTEPLPPDFYVFIQEGVSLREEVKQHEDYFASLPAEERGTIKKKRVGSVEYTFVNPNSPTGVFGDVPDEFAMAEHDGLLYNFTFYGPDGNAMLESFDFDR